MLLHVGERKEYLEWLVRLGQEQELYFFFNFVFCYMYNLSLEDNSSKLSSEFNSLMF